MEPGCRWSIRAFPRCIVHQHPLPPQHCPGPVGRVFSGFLSTDPRACTVFAWTHVGSPVAANCPLHRHRETRFYESLGFSIRPFPGCTRSHSSHPPVSIVQAQRWSRMCVFINIFSPVGWDFVFLLFGLRFCSPVKNPDDVTLVGRR